MREKELESSKVINFRDITLLVSIGFIVTSLAAFFEGPSEKKPLIEFISNNYSYIFYELLAVVLAIFLVAIFKLKIAGELSNFLSSNNKGRWQYFFRALKDAGFKKGEILKTWPYSFTGVFILVAIYLILASPNFNKNLFFNPNVYLFLTKAAISQFTIFLGKAIIFFSIFDYFLNIFKSRKMAYIYSILTVFIIYSLAMLICPNISFVNTLEESIILAPLMIIMYEWSNYSVYYSWILVSTFETLAAVFYAIKFGIFKV